MPGDVLSLSGLVTVGLYSVALFFFTFGITLIRRRLLTYIRLPSILFYISYYMMNLFVLKALFGYHYLYQLMTSAAMGIILVKFRDLNVIGLTGKL